MANYKQTKRTFDIIFAFILLIITSPIMIVAAILIKLNSMGPVLFKQYRPGMNGKIFKVYKFRTMRVETEDNGRPLSDFERMTRVGSILRKTSIDELPQLFNILRGNMSFIGPRPLLVEYLDRYTPEQMRRHQVMPGISGWAQINGRNCIDWEERFMLDTWYVDNMSFSLDLRICLMTIKNILIRKDINNSELNTMPLFMGGNKNIGV